MSGQWSIRRAIKEAKPDAVYIRDIIKPIRPVRAQRSNIAAMARTCVNAIVGRTPNQIQIDSQHRTPLGAFIAICQLLSLQS
eukprot:3544791-Rhodomonas_salina.1